MTSRFNQRAAGVAAATAIILLVILIVLLWTGVGQELFRHSGKHVADSAVRGKNPGGISDSEFRTTYTHGEPFTTVSDMTRPEEIRLPAQQTTKKELTAKSREFVKPIKISPLGLHEDDLLYGSDQLQNGNPEPVQLRHHSGHFRHKTASIWDPHPMYEFTAFQKKFHLVLEHDSGFASPDLQVTHIWHNSSARGLPNIKSNGCFYKGYVKGDPSSSVAVSLCHGMTGHIRTSTGNYFIEPFEQSPDHAKPIEHVIYEMRGISEGKDFHHCGLIDDYEPSKMHRRHESEEIHSKHDSGMLFDYDTDYHHSGEAEKTEANESSQKFQRKRSKRSSQEYFVEMLVVADRTMARYHGAGIENYILALMYIVSGIFKDASIGNPITIALVKLEILYDRNFAHYHYPPNNGVSAADMLREFCRYQASTNTNNDDSVFHHDTALLLTRENICRNASSGKCETLGLAELGTMCDKKSSCSLVQDNGLSAAFTIAHELGHVLNMPHDDAELKCQPHITTDSISHVMSTSLKEGTDPWSWSECSRHFITEFLESRRSYCLKDPPPKDYIRENFSPDVLPGETFAGNRQCELLYGEGSHVCSYMPVCSALWCNKIDSDGCQTLHMPWGDGTPCGDGEWCQKGICVKKNRRALKKVDGGWGSWQGYGACSRTCGGGIKKSYRDCDSPRPQNGGSYCIGERVRYKSCGAKECPKGSKGFREAQCSAFDNNDHNIHGVPSDVKWVPKYGLSNDDRCILYCRVYQTNLYYPLKDKVIDGTPCAPESFDICVNGQCKPAGCDHILSSGVQLDQCGKCGGRNDTCRLIQGSFNESARVQGYRTVIKIPAGSSNLDIRQYGIHGVRDDNYLVLKDGVTGGRLLNNENVLTTFRKLIFYDGVTLEYSGCLKEVERINASRPLRRDLLVEVLSAGSLTPPDIRYQYTVPKSNELRYMWRYLDNEWESCDQVCNGRRKRKMICATVDTNEIVSESYCDAMRKPSVISEPCNTNCMLKWRVTGRTECSNHCGRGTRTITKECVQEIAGHRDPYPVHNSSCLHLPNPPPDVEECQGPCNSVFWKYGEWSPCSKTCGKGVQRREAYCVDELERPMNENKCDPHEKITEQYCEPQSCPTWSFGDWSACSVTCGVGIRTRGHWCQQGNQVIGMNYCNPNTMPKAEEQCTMPACTTWEYSDWQPCSVTCGAGTRKRSLICKTIDGTTVPDLRCFHLPKPPITALSEACQKTPCYRIEDNFISKDPHYNMGRNPGDFDRRSSHRYWPNAGSRSPRTSYRWVTFDWEPCSASCGSGIQKRQVLCLSPYKEQGNFCPNGSRPSPVQGCTSSIPCVKWIEGSWSECSRTCGQGIRQRQVVCEAENKTFIPDDNCGHLTQKPAVQEVCVINPFCTPRKRLFKWKVGSWSPCSKTCGTGEKVREVRCISVREENNEIHERRDIKYFDEYVNDSYCEPENRPKERKDCKRKRLCPYTWIAGEWGPCSAPCGEGIQNRTVTCHQVNSYHWLDPIPLRSGGLCDFNDRPPLSQVCKIRDCSSQKYWMPGKWKPCSHLCGTEGRQKRDWECRDISRGLLRKKDCREIPRPRSKPRPCNIRPCGLTTCTEVQLQTNARVDGEYMMVVGGRNMSVYCKGMNTASPKEYLTLAYPDDNYSEYYDKRLKNPATCPNNGSRTDSCDCSMELDRSGLTRFEKVRLLVETLEIHTQDFNFTRQIRGRPIGLGEAGDCYSKLKCPQGNFRISLEGTLLQISATQKWVGRTINTALNINFENRQMVSGRCGGSCGSCGPSTAGRLKLRVLPPP